MLLALTCPVRQADLSKLDLMTFRNTPEDAVFSLVTLQPQVPDSLRIPNCPVASLGLYLKKRDRAIERQHFAIIYLIY